jgi:hypothetical protein
MVHLAVKCRQVFETFLTYAQGVPVTVVMYFLPYVIVLRLFKSKLLCLTVNYITTSITNELTFTLVYPQFAQHKI